MKPKYAISSPSPVLLLLVMAGCVLLLSRSSVFAEVARSISQKPLYAKVALTEDGSKVLTAVFDESKGTGGGYDLLYADANFNGRFDVAERLTAKTQKCSSGIHCDFPAIKLKVPYGNNAVGMWYPCELVFNYQKHSYPSRATKSATVISFVQSRYRPSGAVRTTEAFAVSTSIELRQGAVRWQYSFRSSIEPSATLSNSPSWNFLWTPTVAISTRPDRQKEGNLGIGLNLAAAENGFECKKGGLPIKAQVEIKTQDGRVVHRGTGTLDSFTFG